MIINSKPSNLNPNTASVDQSAPKKKASADGPPDREQAIQSEAQLATTTEAYKISIGNARNISMTTTLKTPEDATRSANSIKSAILAKGSDSFNSLFTFDTKRIASVIAGIPE
ncbi:MAG: hypothetical protein HQK89_15675 [Nitrospirae bacterium]|nr:hypothetical protein [Nitrospirota bacterium]